MLPSRSTALLFLVWREGNSERRGAAGSEVERVGRAARLSSHSCSFTAQAQSFRHHHGATCNHSHLEAVARLLVGIAPWLNYPRADRRGGTFAG